MTVPSTATTSTRPAGGRIWPGRVTITIALHSTAPASTTSAAMRVRRPPSRAASAIVSAADTSTGSA